MISLCESIGVLKLNGGGGGEKIKQTLFLHLRRHRLNIFHLEKKTKLVQRLQLRLIIETVHCQVIERQEPTWSSGRLHPICLEDQEVNTWSAAHPPATNVDH